MSNVEEVMARAQEQDLNRQRQIENQKMSINRLLDRCNALESKMDRAIDVANVAAANGDASEVVTEMAKILAEPIDE